jgi:peptidoglycan-associated lipoprotein
MDMMRPRRSEGSRGWLWQLVFLAAMVVGLAGSACIQYPNCENDDHCSEKGEYCLNGKCAQCRIDTHCGEGQRCAVGACEAIPGWCQDDSSCSGREKCRDNQCGPECLADNDCAANEECKAGACQEKAQCVVDADCAAGQSCEGGQCVQSQVVDTSCDSLGPVYFDFDESSLSADTRDSLRSHADCIQKRSRPVRVEGHCDARGTEEYNLALGERRARSTRDYLIQLGVGRNDVSTISYGESRPAKYGNGESAWQFNRRCEFVWQ